MYSIFQPPRHHPPKLPHKPLLPTSLPNAPHDQIPPPINPRLPLPLIPTHDPPATLLNNDPTRSHVPGPASPFPIRVQIASGHGAAVQCRAAERAE